ncbi:hypothetical protein ACWEJ6_44530 [Nonomuraea sp. NPDC004702]
MAYATSSDYATYTGTTAPDGIDLLLARASRLVDQVLLCAVYDVDDVDVQAALRDATIEQAAAWTASGIEDGTGAATEWANVSIATVSLGRAQSGGAGGGGSAAIRPAPQTLMVLQQAGLTGHPPWTYT